VEKDIHQSYAAIKINVWIFIGRKEKDGMKRARLGTKYKLG
jgi:hypothetical protein